MVKYIENPKTKDSGIVCCIPQTGECPNRCRDCFYQSGRSYLEPLSENLPNIPPKELTDGRVVRVNDGHDSAVDFRRVLEMTAPFQDKFYNTSIAEGPDLLKWATVLTVNPGDLTDYTFHKVDSPYLMMVRARANLWNTQVLENIVDFYALKRSVAVIITWMNYTSTPAIPEAWRSFYGPLTHVQNEYLSVHPESRWLLDYLFTNPNVYECGKLCKDCGNCIREYYKWKVRFKKWEETGRGSNAANFRV